MRTHVCLLLLALAVATFLPASTNVLKDKEGDDRLTKRSANPDCGGDDRLNKRSADSDCDEDDRLTKRSANPDCGGDDRLNKRSADSDCDGDERLTKRSAKEESPLSRSERSTTYPVLNVEIEFNRKNYALKEFASVALGGATPARVVKGQFDVNDTKFINLAKELKFMDVRCGGTKSQFLFFCEDDEEIPQDIQDNFAARFNSTDFQDSFGKKDWTVFKVKGGDFMEMNRFFKQVWWKMNYNFNGLTVKNDGTFEYDNIRKLIRFLDSKNIVYRSAHVTNEANGCKSKYNFWCSPEETAAVYIKLHEIIKKDLDDGVLTNPGWGTVRWVGPETTSPEHSRWAPEYIDRFLNVTGILDFLWGISFHHYYFKGADATLEDFMNHSIFDEFKTAIDNVKAIRAKSSDRRKLLLYATETAPGYGGGSADFGQRFVSVFIFLDQLGLGVTNGVSGINRQNLQTAQYSILDRYNNPVPNYWILAMWKRLVYTWVYEIKVTHPAVPDPNLRLYTACTNRENKDANGQHLYPQGGGALTLIYVNLSPTKTFKMNITNYFKGSTQPEVHKYIFRGDTADPNYLTSAKIYLNDQLLHMQADANGEKNLIPETILSTPVVQTTGKIWLPSHTVGFIVVKDAHAPSCL